MYNKQKEQPYSQPYELEGKSKILVLHHPKMTHSGYQLQHLKKENITQIFLKCFFWILQAQGVNNLRMQDMAKCINLIPQKKISSRFEACSNTFNKSETEEQQHSVN